MYYSVQMERILNTLKERLDKWVKNTKQSTQLVT
jgi:hypothetical protein